MRAKVGFLGIKGCAVAGVNTVFENMRNCIKQRVLVYGSSNTERHQSGMHWCDCLELALRTTFGRHNTLINNGLCGDTSRGLLARFEHDALFYRPHLVFITIGGNDSSLDERAHTVPEFTHNLRALYRHFSEIDCAVVFQTYYEIKREVYEPQRVERFDAFMRAVREVARDSGCGLVDHLAIWGPFARKFPARYKALMRDAMHVRPVGNMVMGLEIARVLGLRLEIDDGEYWREALECHALMLQAAQE